VNASIQYQRTLVEYDVPQVFLATDAVGTNYLCLLVKQTEQHDRYASVAVSLGRLSDFLSGRVDLLTIMASPEMGVRYYVDLMGDETHKLVLHEVDVFPASWLPEEGFYLEDAPELQTATPVTREASERNRAVLHLAMSPPEAQLTPKIDAYHLSTALGIFQSVVKFAYRKALASVNSAKRKILGTEENYGLEVFAFSPGSFTVHMQSKVPADLMGFVDIERAFEMIDSITAALEHPDSAVDVMQEYRGHLTTSYRKLLGFIVENNAPLSYYWATPERSAPVQHKISVARAAALYDVFTRRKDLGVEEVVLSGRFIKASTKTGEWALETDDGQEYRGVVADTSEVRFDGVVLGTIKYSLNCEERITGLGTGAERSRLFLVRLHPVS
jgi:hypothetical protein